MKRIISVDEYILSHRKWRPELELLRNLIQKNQKLQEGVKWGAPIYTINGKNVVGIAAFKSYVGLWFHQGVYLKDEAKVLMNAQEGKTKALRQWRFQSIDEIDAAMVTGYINEAVKNQLEGKEMTAKRGSASTIPGELDEILSTDKTLFEAFQKLTPFKQKEYCEYIEIAKRAVTKQDRLAKIIPMIREGKGLNDKYR